jgi:hypothetical protein
LVVLVAVQLSVLGLYLPPVFKKLLLAPPQTIISLPVHTAVCRARASGAPVVLVAVQVSSVQVGGGWAQYRPPVFKETFPAPNPPQTIIWLPVHTAV